MALDEAATRIHLIDPALRNRGWTEDLIRRERTPGGVDIVDGRPVKRKGRVDYLLCVQVAGGKASLPVAVLEAKAEDKMPALGLQQGREYGRRFNVPLSFSTNGHLYAEFGSDTRQILDNLDLGGFPGPDELRTRYEQFKGIDLSQADAAPLLAPYRGGDASRYYFQDAAIRAALEKIALNPKGARVLLSLATGAGKTVIATLLLGMQSSPDIGRRTRKRATSPTPSPAPPFDREAAAAALEQIGEGVIKLAQAVRGKPPR
jgi:type I restriction enzyme, R subunit